MKKIVLLRRTLATRLPLVALTFALGAQLSACGKSSSLSIPASLPIVQAALPASFQSSATALQIKRPSGSDFFLKDQSSDITQIKTRLFSPGPTDFQNRLKMVDSRMDEMESAGGECETKEAKAWTVPVGSTGIPLTTMYFQCSRSFNGAGSSGIAYFGKKDGYWYLAEIFVTSGFESGDTSNPTMATLAKIKDDSTTAEVYQLAIEKYSGTDHAVIMQILADKTNGVFEISTASSYSGTTNSNSMYTGLGCGVQMKTDRTNVYADGRYSDGTACGGSATQYCVTVADFSQTGTCTAINTFSSIPMTKAGLVTANAGTAMRDIIVNKTGMPSVDSI